MPPYIYDLRRNLMLMKTSDYCLEILESLIRKERSAVTTLSEKRINDDYDRHTGFYLELN